MENIILNLYQTRNLQVKFTKKSSYPAIFLDGKTICEREIEKHGFKDVDSFIWWCKQTELLCNVKIIST